MGNPFPLPPSHSSATIPQFPFLRTATSSAPQQAQTYHNAPVHIHNPPHVQPPVPTFRAPAHKHAHHLHSIPPREKSTRTLIIDHMLWVHARTRFAQARAELGMTDRTGGPSSPNYTHRRRPENYDEEEEVLSEGEDILFLKTRSGWPGPTHDDDDADHLSKQDLALARSLRLRAEGLESVISSMLDQPPPHHPTDDESLNGRSPSSPKGFRTGLHPHTLPNGVRLRLALGTVINDLFARQAPPQPYRHTHPPKVHEETHPHHPHHSISNLPETLLPLVPLSGAFISLDKASYSSTLSSSQSYSATSGYTTHPTHTSHSHTHLHTPFYTHRPTSSPRVTSFYSSGADPTTANSPPSLRCPRHLHTGCEICVEAKPAARPSPNRSATHAHSKPSSSSTSQWKSVSTDGVGGGLSGWQDGSGIGSGLLRPGIKGSALRRRVYDDTPDKGDKGAGTGNTKLSKLIPRFLRLSALVAAELGQEIRDAEWESPNRPAPPSPALSRAMPPNQSRGKERDEESEEKSLFFNALRPTQEWYLLLAGLLTRAVLEGYLTAGWRGIQPAECLLLVGIGINNHNAANNVGGRTGIENRAVDRGWAGGEQSVDGSDDGDTDIGDEEEFVEFDPDGLPSLGQALRVLFPSLRVNSDASSTQVSGGGQPRKGQAELEYEAEMLERLKRFYDIPESTPDLSTHMEDLAWSYPAEPVERAAIRFCEAVAKWRGKPELETYKKKSPSSPGMSINSLVHSNPSSPNLSNVTAGTPYSLASLGSMIGQPPQPARATQTPPRPRRPVRRPSISAYFAGMTPRAGIKRGRDEWEVEGREEGVKRVHM